MNNNLKLAIITVAAFVLSAYLFWQGLSKEFTKIKTAPSPSPTIAGNVLGEKEELNQGEIKASIIKVVDGDTVEAELDGQVQKVRYIGIDTPETVDPRRPVGCFGKEASSENKRLVEGKSVILAKDVSGTDKFGRLLRYVYIGLDDGSRLFVNDYLIRQGYARASTFPPDVRFSEQFIQAEREARENSRGLWGACR